MSVLRALGAFALLALAACVGGERPGAECPDSCAEAYPNPPACYTPVWSSETCTCSLVAAPDDAPCDDDDACTREDRCAASQCRGTPIDMRRACDDGNDCTFDTCDQRLGCVHDPDPDAAGRACLDDNICTFDSRCNAFGDCRWTNQYVCRQCDPDDPNACGEENSQQNLCDGRLTCVAGFCEVDPTTKPRCDNPRIDPCQATGCDDGDCTTTPFADGTPCSDLSSCTRDDVCRGGVCTGTVVDVPACQCEGDEDCAALDDDDLCNGEVVCRAGTCVLDYATIVVCDPSADSTCSRNQCDPATGSCAPRLAADDTACDDGDPCTTDDHCAVGSCESTPVDCTKFSGRCLVGRCDRLIGCTSDRAEPGTRCRPSEPCNPDGACDEAGDCIAPLEPCDDGDACTIDVCDEVAGDCTFFGPDKPACNTGGVCAGGVGYRCELGEYVCDYAAVAGWSAVERCDGKDDDCDGDTDEACIGEEACAPGALVGAWSGTMQACAGPVASDAIACGAGWHACGYDAMLEALAGAIPPDGYYLTASISFEPGRGHRVVETLGGCVEFDGVCGGAHEVQAVSHDGVFEGAIAFAREALSCNESGDTTPDATSCATTAFAGVMCCVDRCDADADCRDDSACTTDRCVAGRCDNRVGLMPTCPSAGVCVGLEATCDVGGVMVCDPRTLAGYEAIEVSCDGRDNDCDGATDAADPDFAPVAMPCELQRGVCQGAMKSASRCVDGAWTACAASDYTVHSSFYEDAFEGLCDGRDNNCDGATDGGFAWRGLALGATCDGTGECGAGIVECAPSRAAATCSTEPLGSASQVAAERCNGKDDDCDGQTDEAAELDVSESGCGRFGVCAGLAIARCDRGAWTCDTAGIDGFGPERCDGVDNDCDGIVDDGYSAAGLVLGSSCGPNECPNGVVVCAADGDEALCSSEIPGFERCDGVDNDCDGDTDEGLAYDDPVRGPRTLGQACSGRGVCGAGVVECGGGRATCSTASDGSASQASVELCNGLDDDCDGLTDEGFAWRGVALGGGCDGLGACGIGIVECTAAGQATCSTQADGSRPGALPEVCNGADDDCDGQTDDGVVVGPNDCPNVGVCRPEMLDASCRGAEGWRCDYSASPFFQSGSEVGRCDRLDNDCDGQTDEDFAIGTACDGPDADSCARGAIACDPTNASATQCTGDQAAVETCNGVDDDCDGQTDEAGSGGCAIYYMDADGDGFGTNAGECLCAPGPLVRARGSGDCDDASATAFPNAPERCNGKDDDCDGRTDAADAADLAVDDRVPCEEQRGVCQGVDKPINRCVAGTWSACEPSDYLAAHSAYQNNETRCDGLDNNCDGLTDGADPDVVPGRPLCELQQGVCINARKPVALCGANGWQPCTTAIYEAHTATYEAASEQSCDGADNDCDGLVDDDFVWGGRRVGQSCEGVGACGLGVVECAGNAAVCSSNPDGRQSQAQAETCNGVDDDCDGQTDEGMSVGDSPCRLVGVCMSGVQASCQAGQWACDYAQVVGFESNTERSCDDRDNDCDGQTDEDLSLGALRKGDACGPATCTGAIVCNDATPAPGDLVCSADGGQGEICDRKDNDCDGQTDEGITWSPQTGVPLAVGATCDGDGACGAGVVECTLAGGATCSTNPDGSDPEASPEVCNGLDDDCDRTIDEAFTWNGIAMGKACDGVGACGAGIVQCAGNAAATCSTNPNGTSRQDAPETCNGLDDDCDGQTDEGLAITASGCRLSGVCTTSNVVATCLGAAGWSCDYGAVPGYHAGSELGFCDARDNDCDGQTDEDFPELGQACDAPSDADLCKNGVWECGPTSAGAPTCARDVATSEVCGGGDEDCDGIANEEGAAQCVTYFRDRDNDGFGRQGDFKCLCAPSGEYRALVTPTFDCNDDVAAVRPGGSEVCNNFDDDCDGQTDEVDAQGCELYYRDVDDDGFGITSDARCLCDELDGLVSGHTTPVDGDCDDSRSAIAPGAPELCDGRDNDCDGKTDDQDTGLVDCTTFLFDNDGDTYGVATDTQCRCVAGNKYTATRGGDCCDTDDRAKPGQTAYFGSANACGSYDYDCVGGATGELSGNGSCACLTLLCLDGASCTMTPGWTSEPACGQSGSWVTGCAALCLPGTESRTQRCR